LQHLALQHLAFLQHLALRQTVSSTSHRGKVRLGQLAG
jgi:hypothetical protein